MMSLSIFGIKQGLPHNYLGSILFSERLGNYWNYFSFKYLVERDSKDIWTLSYLWYKVLSCEFNFFLTDVELLSISVYNFLGTFWSILSELWASPVARG